MGRPVQDERKVIRLPSRQEFRLCYPARIPITLPATISRNAPSPPTGRRKHQPPPPYAGTQVTDEISLNSRHSFCQLSPRSSLRYK